MPGFYLASYNVEEFAMFDPTVIGGKDTHWEGKKYTISYELKEGAARVSTLQIIRNYEAAVRKIGGTLPGGDERRMTAQIRKGGAMTGVYVEAFNDGRNYVVTIVESQEMRQDVVADAAAMGRDLEASGKTIIYGIHFGQGNISGVALPSLNLQVGIENNLDAKLDAASKALNDVSRGPPIPDAGTGRAPIARTRRAGT